jgi:hypothetical protein
LEERRPGCDCSVASLAFRRLDYTDTGGLRRLGERNGGDTRESSMDLRRLDLNLLVILDALL